VLGVRAFVPVLDEQGPLEIVGHRAGTAKSSREGSTLSAPPASVSAPTAKMQEEARAVAAEAAASPAGAAVQGQAAAAVAAMDLAGSREDEDRAILGGSGDGLGLIGGAAGVGNRAGGKSNHYCPRILTPPRLWIV